MDSSKSWIPLAISLSFITVAAAAFAGCPSQEQARPAQRDQGAALAKTAEPAKPALDARSQYDFVADIVEVEKMDPEDAEIRYAEIRRDYKGKRYRWQVDRIAALCPSSERCNVLPFDLNGTDHKKVVQGWMPRLDLTAEVFAALDAKCQGQSRCSFRFEGTLDKLVLSTEHLTSLQFKDVTIL